MNIRFLKLKVKNSFVGRLTQLMTDFSICPDYSIHGHWTKAKNSGKSPLYENDIYYHGGLSMQSNLGQLSG